MGDIGDFFERQRRALEAGARDVGDRVSGLTARMIEDGRAKLAELGVGAARQTGEVNRRPAKPASPTPPANPQAPAQRPPAARAISASQTPPRGVTYRYPDGVQELREGGTFPWRGNNPGDIGYGNFAKQHGAVGVFVNGKTPMAIFPDVPAGKAAMHALLTGPKYHPLTINGAIAAYAPARQNDTAAYQRFVTGKLGLSGDTPMSSLTPQQLEALEHHMSVYEGFNPDNPSTIGRSSWIYPK